uniref:NR LBD domain-containing protein n=1 Tax=Parascaris univalens TaxID=6257 RepID=A0A915A8I4_PARUN
MEKEDSCSTCGVCGDVSDGLHFGAIACRACAAFFRRSTVSDRKYTCRFDGDCPIGKDVRCMCRACRLRKCIELGMNAKSARGEKKPTIAQAIGASLAVDALSPSAEISSPSAASSHTDTRLPSTAQPYSPQDQPVALPTPVITHMPDEIRQQTPMGDFLFGLPLIGQAIIGYRKLLSLRRTARSLQPGHQIQKLFEEKSEWREINFNGSTAMLRTDVSLTAEMVNEHFPPFNVIETDHKQRLFRNFFACFILIERAYLSSCFFPGKSDDRFAFSHNAFFEINNLVKYYECDTVKVEPVEAAKIFKPTYDVVLRCLKEPMAELRFTEAEMVGLLALCLWNDAIDGISEETSAIAKQTRNIIYRELFLVCSQTAPESAPERLGAIVHFLTVAQRISARMTENFSIAKLFNIFDIDAILFDLMPTTAC